MSSIDSIRVLRCQLDVAIHQREYWKRKYATLHVAAEHALRCLEHNQPPPPPRGFTELVCESLREALKRDDGGF